MVNTPSNQAARDFAEAVAAGRDVYAVVLRRQSVRQVPGREVKAGELLAWCCPGFTRWRRVAVVKTVPVRWTPPAS